MTAFAALTLADGLAVAHTFSPAAQSSDGVALWEDRLGGIPVGFPRITHSLRRPSAKNRNYKLTIKVFAPVLEITSPSTGTGIQPAPTVAYELSSHTDIIIPERSTLAQRKDLIAYHKNLFANAVITASVENFEAVW